MHVLSKRTALISELGLKVCNIRYIDFHTGKPDAFDKKKIKTFIKETTQLGYHKFKFN